MFLINVLITTVKRSKIHSSGVLPPLFSAVCTVKADATWNLITKTERDKSTGKAFTVQQPVILYQAVEYPHIFLKISLEEREQQGKTKTTELKNENWSKG